MNEAADPIVHGAPEAVAALFTALDAAIGETRAVPKHGEGQGYKYALAEDVMREADRVLAPQGITVAPISGALFVVYGPDDKLAKRHIVELRCRWIVAHKAGGWFVGGMAIAVPMTLNSGPPQATSAAYTSCERDFFRGLLRMPRGPEDDVEHEKNRREPPPPEPAKPAVRPPTTERKVTRTLAVIAAIKDVAAWDKVRERWDREVLSARSPEDDLGYTAEDCAAVKQALADAATRVGA